MLKGRWSLLGLLGIVALAVSLPLALRSDGEARASDLAQAQSPVPPQVARVRVFIGFQDPAGPAQEALIRGVGGSVRYTYQLIPYIAAELPASAVAVLEANPHVISIEEDSIGRIIDAELDNSWGVKRIGAGIVHAYSKGAGTKIAIVDTGADYTHPELDANFDPGKRGYDFVNTDNDPLDDHGHGSHVAGIAAAEDNGAGVVGVAPEARLYALKVCDSGGFCAWSDVIAAIEWATGLGGGVKADSVNISLGFPNAPGAVRDAFGAAYNEGLILVAAAGNSGNCLGKGNNVEYPARLDQVIAVAATNQTDTSPCFSSTGDQVELSAPGVEVNSTWLGGGYHVGTGTSMASPHVAGTAALVVASGISDANGDGRINDDVRLRLQQTADDLGAPGRDTWYGYGLVDADEAAPNAGVAPTATPTATPTPTPQEATPTATPTSTVPTATPTPTSSPVSGDLTVAIEVVGGPQPGDRVTIDVAVSDSGGPVSGASVALTLDTVGRDFQRTKTTNESGVARFRIKTKSSDSFPWTITADASKNGSSGSDTIEYP